MDYAKKALELHEELRGKIETAVRVPVKTREDLSLAYTPGVAQPCLEIQKDINKSYDLTRRWNTVAVVTDGTAVLGLGDIGPEAGMPVMEGKCCLFKAFGDVDAVPICIRSKDVDDIVKTVQLIAGSFGGINLEDISAPRCFEIEKRLIETCDIPVFHDDQHGTAIVMLAALLNALRVVNKKIDEIKLVLSGPGAAGNAIIRMLMAAGVKNIIAVDEKGILSKDTAKLRTEPHKLMLCQDTNPENINGSLADALVGADVFIGVSVGGCVTKEMVQTMNKDAIIFACANPTPEIFPEEAKAGGAKVVASGRSDYPNQINNVLCFPALFRGVLDARAKVINSEMKIAAAKALAGLISDEELSADNIIPSAFDEKIKEAVSTAVADAAKATGA